MAESPTVIDQTLYYRDLNANFKLNSRGVLLDNTSALNIQIFLVLNTVIGERIKEPTFGSNVPNRVFEPCDEITAYDMETDIFMALDTWMSDRIILDYGATKVVPIPEEMAFHARIVYMIRENNTLAEANIKFTR